MATFNANMTFEGDIDDEDLNQLVENDQYLKDNLVAVKFGPAFGLDVTTGVKIFAGVEPIRPRRTQSEFEGDVEFGDWFSPTCKPSVILTLSTTNRIRTFTTVRGLGNNSLEPDHRGFHYTIAHQLIPGETWTFSQPLRLNWIAIGY